MKSHVLLCFSVILCGFSSSWAEVLVVPGQSNGQVVVNSVKDTLGAASEATGALLNENTGAKNGGDSETGGQAKDRGEGRIKTLDDSLDQEAGVTGYSEGRGRDEADPEAGYRDVDTTKSQDRVKQKLKDLEGLSPQEINEILND